MNMTRYFSILLITLFLSSCSPFQKALKSEDIKEKYEVAEKLYERGKYDKAIRLFEQIAPSYRGKPQAEKMFYMYAQSFFKTKQYYSAGYQFESFAAGYPRSEKMEEALFLGAKSFYFLSPVYSLDQVDTNKAIDKLQNFINSYPNSQYLPEANLLVKELREKLEKKAFEIAKQYNTIMDYKAAVKALDNFVIDYPGTPFKEDALYYKLDSSYQLAINSVQSRMQERLELAKGSYAALLKFNGETKYKKQADAMLAKIETELQKFSK
jgi:outer membrane protein assembly factor BamD